MTDNDSQDRTYRLALPDSKKLAILGIAVIEVTHLLIGSDYQTTFRLLALIALLILGLYCAHLSDIEKKRQFVRQYGTVDPTEVEPHDPDAVEGSEGGGKA